MLQRVPYSLSAAQQIVAGATSGTFYTLREGRRFVGKLLMPVNNTVTVSNGITTASFDTSSYTVGSWDMDVVGPLTFTGRGSVFGVEMDADAYYSP